MNERKKILIIGTDGLPARYGGFETLVEQLSLSNTLAQNFEIDVQTSSSKRVLKDKKVNNFGIAYCALKANGMSSLFYDMLGLLRGVREGYDIILCLGVSVGFSLPVLKLLWRKNKIVVNIDGIEWRRKKWGTVAKLVLYICEKSCVKFADKIIVDNEGIRDYVKNNYKNLASDKYFLIPYGGDQFTNNIITPVGEKGQQHFFAMSRIELENNVHLILEAAKDTNCNLIYYGNWENSVYAKKLYRDFVDFLDLRRPDYDIQRIVKNRSICKYYIHGHSAGGTNPSLVEAMHSGHTIIAYDCVFNRYTTENKAHYFKSIDELKMLITSAQAGDLTYNSKEMQQIAETRYTWSAIEHQYMELLSNE